MFDNKDLDNKSLYYIYTWVETLAFIAWAIIFSYHRTIGSTPVQDVFGTDMILNLVSVFDWRVVTAKEQKKIDIDHVRKNARRVSHDYATGDLVYMDMTDMYQKLYHNKYGMYRIT